MSPSKLAKIVAATRRKADAGDQQSTAVVELICKEAERLQSRVIAIERANTDMIIEGAEAAVFARNQFARVAELEAEKLALDTCWRCKVTLEKVGSPESRVPRCTECPEPDSMDDVEQDDGGGS